MEFNNFNNRRRGFLGYFICGTLGAIFGCALLLLFGPSALFSNFTASSSPPPPAVGTAQSLVTTASAITDVGIAANKVMPAVVGIVRPIVGPSKQKGNGGRAEIGTGVVVDPSGYILTNNHVADRSKDLSISLYDGRVVTGRVVWADSVLDVSIVKVNASDLAYATLGNSLSVKVGDTAIAIGNPLGLKFQRSVTSGIVSAINRTVQIGPSSFMEDLIQTDASINPGNSGGPLINIEGQVIGINTIKVITAEGMGFAIPINMCKPIINSIKKTGKFEEPVLGIEGADYYMTAYFDFKVEKGVYVYNCVPGSPGYNAGLRIGDSIVAVNGNNINTLLELKEALYSIGINGTAILDVLTPQKTTKTLTVKLVPFQYK